MAYLLPAPTEFPVEGPRVQVGFLARDEQTGGRLLAFRYDVKPGFGGPALHVHEDLDEVLFVISGTLTVQVGDERGDLSDGGFAWMPRGVPHGYANPTDGLVSFLNISTPSGNQQAMFTAMGRYMAGLEGPPDPAEITAINQAHGAEVIGPPILADQAESRKPPS